MALTGERVVYYDEVVDLTGLVVSDVTFDGCVLHMWKSLEKTHVKGCEYLDCLLVGDGWPPWVRHSVTGVPRTKRRRTFQVGGRKVPAY